MPLELFHDSFYFFGQTPFHRLFHLITYAHNFLKKKMKLLFAEEGAVYDYVGDAERGYITKLPLFSTDQEIHVPKDWVYFPLFPREINEKIYYYCFLNALKDRNFEAAYFYATHVSAYLTKKIYTTWFENPAFDLNFDRPASFQIMCLDIRGSLTFASLLYDVVSEKRDFNQVYPMKLEFVSRYRRRTNPAFLARLPPPCSFIDHEISFNILEMEDPMLFATQRDDSSPLIVEHISFPLDPEEEDDLPHHVFAMIQEPVFQNVDYLEFHKGPFIADFCLVDGHSEAPGIFNVKKLMHPCIFIEIFDCEDTPWVEVENYTSIQNNPDWKKFQKFLQYCIESNLTLFFKVGGTNTFVTFQ